MAPVAWNRDKNFKHLELNTEVQQRSEQQSRCQTWKAESSRHPNWEQSNSKAYSSNLLLYPLSLTVILPEAGIPCMFAKMLTLKKLATLAKYGKLADIQVLPQNIEA